jgi:predicted DNA binding CopG/RHH family protein
MSKNERKTKIGSDLMDQLNGNPIDFLTKPTQKIEKSTKNMNLNGNKRNQLSSLNVPERQKSQEKERMTVQISKDTIERVKNCVYWDRLTVAQFVEEALKAALSIAEAKNGKPFQKRRSELKPGRPIK